MENQSQYRYNIIPDSSTAEPFMGAPSGYPLMYIMRVSVHGGRYLLGKP